VSVSVTTRAPRPGETDGVEYHFAGDDEFDLLVASGALLEHATYAGHRYGTPRAPVEQRLREGVPALLEIDLQGARQVRAAMPDSLLVFLAPPTFDELARRLVGRGTETDDRVRHRLDLARIEMAAEDEFDEVVVNETVEATADRVVALLVAPPS
jgi:guanylate kinase